MNTKTKILVGISFVFVFFGVLTLRASAALLSVSPSAGTFVAGSTFDVSVILDTEGEAINAIEVSLRFPSDKLQLVSPSAGKSIIALWATPPQFNNQTGRVDLQGGIPGGINMSQGLVTTLSFRVKSVGVATLKFLDNSRVLLNDGLGTDVLSNTQNGVYKFVLPPPAGPIVASETHPEQSRWYSNPTVVLSWAHEENVEGYSYIIKDEDPVDIADDISEGIQDGVAYKNLADGTHYFHIKALRKSAWGGTTHFAINVDTTPPAEFPIDVLPSSRTSERKPIIQFATTDSLSGVSHYELKIIPLKNLSELTSQPLFIETTSPYTFSKLELGSYDILIRVYDQAGNYREVTKRLNIVRPIFKLIADRGVEVKGIIIIPWVWFWIIIVIVIAGLGYLAWRLRRWHNRVHTQRVQKELPSNVKKQLGELKKYRSRYGNMAILIFFLGATLFFGSSAFAQQIELGPPLITTISRNISNEEIFYIGGKTEAANSEVIIYLQNLQSGETISQSVTSDKFGDWFYRHNAFLSSGNHVLWTQSKLGEQLSPPSPQVQMTVRPTAIQFGASRISYEVLYLGIIIVLLFAIAGLVIYIVYHAYHGRKKHKKFIEEVKEAEEAVKRGFAVLRRDIEAELAVIKKAKEKEGLTDEEKAKESQLLIDLGWIERQIGKEIWDIEKAEHFD